jgi:hypothetical protein
LPQPDHLGDNEFFHPATSPVQNQKAHPESAYHLSVNPTETFIIKTHLE